MNVPASVVGSILQNIEVICVVLVGIVLILFSRVNSRINHKTLQKELLLHLGIASVVAAAAMFFIDRRLADRLLDDVDSHLDRHALSEAVGGDNRLLGEVERQIFRRPIRYYDYRIDADLLRISGQDPHAVYRAKTTIFVRNIGTRPVDWTFRPAVSSNRKTPANARLMRKPTIRLCLPNTTTPDKEDLVEESSWTEYLSRNKVTPEDIERGFQEKVRFSATVTLQPEKTYEVIYRVSFDEELANEAYHLTKETADSMTLNFTYNPSEFDIEPEVRYPTFYSETDKSLVRLPSKASLDSVRGESETHVATIAIDSWLLPFQGIHVEWRPRETK